MVSFDNSLLNSRGVTGPDGQDMWEKNQGQLDIPAGNKAREFIIQDITLARSESLNHNNPEHEEHNSEDINDKIEMRFSVIDSIGHLWTIEIKFEQTITDLNVVYVKQKYPIISDNSDIKDSKYLNIPLDITNTRKINLTKFFQKYSNIGTPNALTIDKMDPEILYVNFLIN
jgi:hypothetical protein